MSALGLWSSQVKSLLGSSRICCSLAALMRGFIENKEHHLAAYNAMLMLMLMLMPRL